MKKIIGLGGKLLGIGGKKKKDAAAAPAEQKGPIVTQLGPGVVPPNRRRGPNRPGQRPPTILGGLDGKLGY